MKQSIATLRSWALSYAAARAGQAGITSKGVQYMKKNFIAGSLFLLTGLCLGQTIPVDSLYLAQTPPDTIPIVFQLPITSGLRPIERIAITSDRKEIYYSELNGYPPTLSFIKYFKYVDGIWQGPFELFNGYVAPALSPNDSIMYVQMNPTYSTAVAYYSTRTDTGWSAPVPMFSFSQQSHYTQKTSLNNYYLSTDYPGSSLRDLGLVVINGADTTTENLGMPVSTELDESDFFIARDESYIMHIRHTAGIPGDVYISYKKPNGSWTNSKSLGSRINTPEWEYGMFVTPDNKYLFFTRGGAAMSSYYTYWVKVDGLIDSLRYTNFIPYVKSAIPGQIDTAGQYFSFSFSDSAFIDDDGNNTLSYSATLSDGSPLPAWLLFNPTTRTFSGTLPETDTFAVKVTATDTASASVSSTFNLVVNYATHTASLSAPNGGEVVSGTYNIAWNTAVPNCTTNVYVSRDQGQTWTMVAAGQPGSGQYSWNTAAFPDGIRYRARIFSYRAISLGWDESDGDFIVDNPGNGAPEVSIPVIDTVITGSYPWPWWRGDADGDQLVTTLAVRRSGQSGWTTVVDTLSSGASNTRLWSLHSYTWNTDSMIDDRYQFKVSVFDGSAVTSDSTTSYSTITNPHSYIPTNNTSGPSTLPFSWYVIHPERLTGHTYEARFKPIVRNNYTLSAGLYPAEYKYDLWDATTATLVWADRELPTSLTAGVCSYYDPGVVFTGCVPTCGSSSYLPSQAAIDSIKRPASDLSADTVKGVRIMSPNMGWACLNTAMDIRWRLSGATPNDTLWPEVWDVAYNVQIPFDSTGLNNQTVPCWNLGGTNTSGSGKRYMTAASSLQRKFMNLAGYRLYFNNNTGIGSGLDMTWATHPQEGDIWHSYCSGPIPPREGDVYSFTPTGVEGAPNENNIASLLLHQNAPNPFKQQTTINYQLAKPGLVNLKVYNIAGQLVKTLAGGQTAAGHHSVKWDGRDDRGNKVSSGVYIYRLQAGNKELTRKLVILR